jgi:uncharacterized protein YceH (UPF0502 family)
MWDAKGLSFLPRDQSFVEVFWLLLRLGLLMSVRRYEERVITASRSAIDNLEFTSLVVGLITTLILQCPQVKLDIFLERDPDVVFSGIPEKKSYFNRPIVV